MANQYAVGAGGNWSAAGTWESAPGNADSSGPPAGGDDVLFVAASGAVAVDGATNALGSLDMLGYVNVLTVDNAVDVDGSARLDGTFAGAANISIAVDITTVAGTAFTGYTGSIVQDGAAGAPTLTTNAAALPDIQVNNAGVASFILQDDMACGALTLANAAGVKFDTGANDVACDAFAMPNGTLAGSGAIDVGGAINISGGTNSHTGQLTQTATGSVVIAAVPAVADLFLADTGVTSTLTGDVYCKKFTHGAGTVALGNQVLYVAAEAGNDFWVSGTGAFTAGTGSICWYGITDGRTQGAVTVSGAPVSIMPDAAGTLTATGAWTFDTAEALTIMAVAAGNGTVDMAGNRLVAGDMVLGDTAANNINGILTCGEGVIAIGGLADGNAANLANEIQLESCYLQSSGTTLDFANIAHSATADNVVHIVCLAGADVANFDPAQIVHCHGDANVDNGSAAGANNGVNNATTFNTHAHPGSAMMLGAGC